MRQMGGIGASSVERAKWGQNGAQLNRFVGAANIPHTSGTPTGYLHPRSWAMPLKPGGMASRNLIVGEATLAATGVAGTLMDAALASTTALSADAYGAFSTAASLTSSGTLLVVLSADAFAQSSILSDAALAALLSGVAISEAALTAAGTLGANATSTINLAGALTGDATTFAEAYGAFSAEAALAAAGAVAADMSATSQMASDIFSAAALNALLQAAVIAQAALLANSTLTADAGLTANIAAPLNATATLSAEAVSGFAAAAALTATGTVGSSLVGVFSIAGDLLALGTLSSTLTAQAYAAAALTATGTLNVTTSATGSMVAHITETAEAVNPVTIAQAVWDHITALHLIDTTDETLAEILAGGGSITIGDVQTAMTLQGYTMARGEFLEQLDPERQDGVTQILMQLRAGCIALEQAISQTIPLPYAAYSPRPVIGPSDQQPPVPEPTPPLALPAVVPVTGLPANYRFMPRQPLNGVRDGVNKIFTTVVPFVSGDSVREVVYRSGVRVPVTDYRVNTAERSITFLRAPQPTDTLYLDAYVETAP